ncbi:ATP binding protein [Corchorus olitorius]|uniref:ATP binding protein n=1 Tax=Corchorus olitorius TaxID=93759 RepID=A0A1R3KYV7_9ROSI|nr:ATP binding protein [Corchorus olitorius]
MGGNFSGFLGWGREVIGFVPSSLARLLASIQKVPALILDCEPDIDFSRDIDAKRQYARKNLSNL